MKTDWSGFSPLAPTITHFGYAPTKDAANAVLSSVGNPVTDAGDNTFYLMFAEPLGSDADYLITVDANEHVYGVVSPASSREKTPGTFKLYFQLGNGKQTDFLDGVKVESAESAKCDLSSFSGTATVRFYRTDTQEVGVYPTSLQLIKLKTIEISNG